MKNTTNLVLSYDIVKKAFSYLTYRQTRLLFALILANNDGIHTITESWIFKTANLEKTHYVTTRKELSDMGWIEYSRDKDNALCSISVNFNNIENYTNEKYEQYKKNKASGIYDKRKTDTCEIKIIKG